MKHLEAIKAKLKAQHPGLPQAILDRVANLIAKTAKDEATDEELTQAVANQKDIVTDLADYAQKEGDRRVTEAQKKADGKTPPPAPANPAPAAKEDIPEWAKGLIQKVEAIAHKDAAKSTSEKLQGLLKDKVPASFYGLAVAGKTFESDEDANAFAAQIEAQYTAFKQEQATGSLGEQKTPGVGSSTGKGAATTEVSADVKAFVAKNTPKAPAQA